MLSNALPLLSLMCGKFVQYLDTQATIDQKLLDIVIVIAWLSAATLRNTSQLQTCQLQRIHIRFHGEARNLTKKTYFPSLLAIKLSAGLLMSQFRVVGQFKIFGVSNSFSNLEFGPIWDQVWVVLWVHEIMSFIMV